MAHEIAPAEVDPHPHLPNAPLVEAIVELHWALQDVAPGVAVDSGYPLAAGRLYDLVRNEFPFVEQLPVATIPDQFTPHIVKQRFRVGDGQWPVLQIGPGVATVNFTQPYSWATFRDRVLWFIPLLRQAYQREGAPNLDLTMILMRYLDAIEMNFEENDVLTFLAQRMHTVVQLPEPISAFPHRDGNPRTFTLSVGLPLTEPNSVATLQYAIGERSGHPALIWDLTVRSSGPQVAGVLDHPGAWLEAAHDVNTAWFVALTEGELMAQFAQEGDQ